MITIQNQNRFNEIVETAKAKAEKAGRADWVKAIVKAVAELDNNPYITEQGSSLLILSFASTSEGRIYSANGVCGCKAYQFKNACWHRALARLIRLYREQEALTEWQTLRAKAIRVVTTELNDFGRPTKIERMFGVRI